jgi:hypothetical protein
MKIYIEDKNEFISGEIILYHGLLRKWCIKYGFRFEWIKLIIPRLLKIKRNIMKRIGEGFIWSDDRYLRTDIKYGSDELNEMIITIFEKVYRNNKAIFIKEVKKYIISSTDESIDIPKTQFLDYGENYPSVIGYTNVFYISMKYPKVRYIPIITCPYALLYDDDDN